MKRDVKNQLKCVLTEEDLVQMQVYSVSKVYSLLVGTHEKVCRDKYVWNRISIYLFLFMNSDFLWLALKQILQTT